MSKFIAQHKAAFKAKQGIATGADNRTPVAKNYELWQAACKHDWDALKAIPDHAQRNKQKPVALEKYRAYLNEWFAAGYYHQNDVLVRNLVWACDANQWAYALDLADMCAKSQQANTLMERTCETFFVDCVHQALIPNSATDLVEAAIHAAERIVSKKWMVGHISHAKLYRSIAKHAKAEKPALALIYAKQANDLYANVGVKTLIQELEDVLQSPRPQADTLTDPDDNDSLSFNGSTDCVTPVLT